MQQCLPKRSCLQNLAVSSQKVVFAKNLLLMGCIDSCTFLVCAQQGLSMPPANHAEGDHTTRRASLGQRSVTTHNHLSEQQDQCVAWYCREGGAMIHHDSMRPRWSQVRAGSISIQIQQQWRSVSSNRGERRAAAATENSLVQARKSGLTKTNIDQSLHQQSLVVLQARAQLQETIIGRRLQHKCAGDWQLPFMVVLKAGDHSCRMTHEKNLKTIASVLVSSFNLNVLVSSHAYGRYFFGRD